MTLERARFAFLLILPLTACAGATAAAPPPDALAALNLALRHEYGDARARALAQAGPLLIVSDKLVLLHGSGREEHDPLPPIYLALKAVSHVALGLQALLEEPRPPDALARLAALRPLLAAAASALDARLFTPAQLSRQRALLEESLALVDTAAASALPDAAALARWDAKIAPLLQDNLTDAAKAQVASLHAQVQSLRAKLSVAEWDALHVVIIAAHMPREGLVAEQYFERLLHEPFEGGRIIYAESLWAEPDALSLLGTHLVDFRIGQSLFGDGRRMHRDLLADAAAAEIRKVLP